MPSRQHQSPVLLGQSVSPPHLLSPELIPATTSSTLSQPVQSSEQLPSEMSGSAESVVETAQGTTSTQAESNPPSEATAEPTGAPTQEVEETAGQSTTDAPTNSAPETNTVESSSGSETITNADSIATENPSTATPSPESSTVADQSPAAADATAIGQEETTAGTGNTLITATEATSEPAAASTLEDAPAAATETTSQTTTENVPGDAAVDTTTQNADGEAQAAPPPEPEPEVEDTTPTWVKFEEDTSVPDEDELKEIEESDSDRNNATNIRSMEEHFFSDIKDPDQRPAKKLRMSWVLKGVRGTRERPNMAKIMNSPAVCVDGMYWSIKFYPRGDNCTSLSAFVRCSRVPPRQADEMPEHTFSFFQGKPDADFAKDYEPTVKVSAPNTQRVREPPKPKKRAVVESGEDKAEHQEATTDEQARSPSPESDRPASPEDDDEDAHDRSDDACEKDLKDWRVSAQLGMTIYNPNEPRTAHFQSDGHQFTQHCDDWGWVNFVSQWDELHVRKRGQRRPLLQNDMLAIDAYVLIYDDPTQALWWHESKDEGQWPSKKLAGFHPMGTPALYHSPAVAGITAWTVLAPFRKIIQAHDGAKWFRDSDVAPTPLICQTQLVLRQMRNLVGDVYVNVYKIIEELTEVDEPWEDVKSFWEVFRRGLELEFKGDQDAIQQFANIFDAGGKPFKMPSLSLPGDHEVASGLERYFDSIAYKDALPNFLPVMINRQRFDKEKRDWTLHEDRVKLTDNIDLSKWTTDDDADYTLYGFVVHVNGRSSGKFYTVLRPGGVGTKWLAFEDGHGNKVHSYTTKRIRDFEGLEGDALKNFTGEREKAYMALYLRNSCWDEYLPGEMEPYTLPKWLRSYVPGSSEIDEATEKAEALESEADEKKRQEEGIKVELYLDETVHGCENMLELHDLRSSPDARRSRQVVMVAVDKTNLDLRRKIAEAFEIDDVGRISISLVCYRGVGRFSRAELDDLPDRKKVKRYVLPGDTGRIWVSVRPAEGEGQKSYREFLSRIAEMGLEIKKPVEESISAPAESETKGSEETSASEQPTPVAEQPAIDDSTTQPADTSSSHTEDSTTTGIATPATGETGDSAPDVEQASIAAAVSRDVEQASITGNTSAPAEMVVTEQQQPDTEASRQAPAADTTQSSATETPSTDGSSSIVTPTPDHPLEHNHLVDAVQHSNAVPSEATDIGVQDLANSTTTRSIEATLSGDEISAEDAAAIAALLAEDEAAVQATTAQDNDNSAPDEPSAAATEPVVAEVGSGAPAETEQQQTPSPPPVQRIYGFVHVFDADGQKFVAHRPINPDVESEINPVIRKALGYSDDKEIRIWKRDGPTGTAPVTGNVTFSSYGFSKGFTLLVGEYLSETKIDELKHAGKFWQPAHLIKNLIMSRRSHPILSVTSSDPVEFDDFGGDYYKGPIVNGQPHGDKCFLITAAGHTYEGPLVAGLKSGSDGKMTYQNGDTYKGQWLNDECHGQGEHIEFRTGNRYVGGYENGKKWGEGVTYWKVADDQAAMCQVCYGEEIDALFYDCGHVCACVECAKQCENCPICRKTVRQVVKMFRA